MVSILTADIHQTTDPRDSYRWGLFPWLVDQVRRHKADYVFILGDGTGNKDRHPSTLVNPMVGGISSIAEHAVVIWVPGNHDYIDPANPYFAFLSKIPNVVFALEPLAFDKLKVAGKEVSVLLLPNSPNPLKDWAELRATFRRYRYIFCHQTFAGAVRENGTTDTGGVPFASLFADCNAEIYSGDIHVPQKLGKSGPEYVGAPYRIDFGDRYTPRALLLKADGSKADLHFDCPSKHLVEISPDGELSGLEGIRKGDQVKVRARLPRESFALWPKLQKQVREMAAKGGWQLYGPELCESRTSDAPRAAPKALSNDPATLVRQFSKAEKLSRAMADLGEFIVREA